MSGHECDPAWVRHPSYDIAAGFCECGQGWIEHCGTPVAKVKAVAQAELDRISTAPAPVPPVPPDDGYEGVVNMRYVGSYNQTQIWTPLGAIENLYKEAMQEELARKPIFFGIT